MKRIIFYFSLFVLLAAASMTAYAAENTAASSVSITVVIPNQPETVKETPAPAPKPPVNYLYPVSVYESRDSGRREIIKTYELGKGEKPADISRESFTLDGWLYELTDIIKKEMASADTREYTELVEQFSATNDTAAILKLFEPSYEFINENGYMGTMTLDISTLKVETAGTKTNSFTVSATRQYPHLSSNDTSLIPKTITENGRTLTLSNLTWTAQNTVTIDSAQFAESYMATAIYTGTGYSTSVTGYTATAEYRGTLSKIITGKTVYTACFIGIPIVTPTVNSTEVAETPTSAPEMTETPTTEQNTEPTTAELEIAEEPTKNTEIAVPTETAPPSETFPPETIAAEPTDTADEPESDVKPFNSLPIIIIVLAVALIGGGFAYFYFNKNKKESAEE